MLLLICLAILATIYAVTLATKIIKHENEMAAARNELAALPQLETAQNAPVWSTLGIYEDKMRAINPDYVGLLTTGGADYFPVVRGSDNEKYLTTSYAGDENMLGAVFMDYRCVGDNLPHLIIYAHNAIDLSGNSYFFNGLNYFLEPDYLAANPIIGYIESDLLYEFEIFSARVTDTNDPAYQLDFSGENAFEDFLNACAAPENAPQILTLSTCYVQGNDDARIIVQGALREVLGVDRARSTVGER